MEQGAEILWLRTSQPEPKLNERGWQADRLNFGLIEGEISIRLIVTTTGKTKFSDPGSLLVRIT